MQGGQSNPRIYVACLASYNVGHLYGAWIEARHGAEAIRQGIRRMLARSPVEGAEEYAIHNYEGFEGAPIHEYASPETVAELAAFIVEHGALGAAILGQFAGDMDQAQEAMTARYLGSYPSLADYMQEATEEAAAIPEPIRFYVDWDAMARDAELSGDLFTIRETFDTVHVFAGR